MSKVQFFEGKITKGELRDLIKENDIRPGQLFSKEDFLNCKPLMKAMAEKKELEDFRAAKDKKEKEDVDVDSMIPGDDKPILTPEQKKQQEKDNELIPDGKGDPGDDDLIPD